MYIIEKDKGSKEVGGKVGELVVHGARLQCLEEIGAEGKELEELGAQLQSLEMWAMETKAWETQRELGGP